MIAFLTVAGLMALLATAIVLWPLLRSANASAARWPTAVVVTVLIPALAFGLYQVWSNWSWRGGTEIPGVPPAVAQMVARLEARLQANPNDVNGWLLLGRSYFQLGQYLRAADAYEHAYTQSGGENVDAILGLGETLVFAEGRAITPRSAQLFERAFERAPHDPR
ncbi:MAG TPA: hypothetical protein VEZ88_13380, partial [Steroidobacteraceae bacterium]|nr:hypothetical protein [Steroidobacteraceae bacterium]